MFKENVKKALSIYHLVSKSHKYPFSMIVESLFGEKKTDIHIIGFKTFSYAGNDLLGRTRSIIF